MVVSMVLRGNGLLRDVLKGRMLGKRVRGRPSMRMIDDLIEDAMYEVMKRTERREEWRLWVRRTCLKAEYC